MLMRLVRWVAVLAAAAGLVAIAPAAAQAAVGDLVCTATSTTTFSPGLTLVPTTQSITFSVQYSGCTSTNGVTVTGGSRSGSFTGVRSCLSVPPSGSGSVTVTWNDATTSTIDGTSQSVDVGGQSVHTLTGPVTSGRLSGDTFVEEITQASLNLLTCATTGVTSQSGIGVVTLA